MIGKLFTWPLDTVVFAARKVKEEADRQYYDPKEIQRQLALLQLQLDEGTLSEEEYDEQEEVLLERYRQAKGEES
ncbi:gas vesicle protein GvpG [Alkalicoccus urumqiensis]|uniref:Gas vesicle protein GvpG n=1 Tax=Alkalicoccus urumqiensis TaxID=1548213 RepID=A0A2P6MIW7_ALKUR|nr:gas vesicle protein GvpG [Alkalicoccus urumqiensis]PRO66183.1 gas vesicle protein GvpG [Alkalicoccus urumqiensis]